MAYISSLCMLNQVCVKCLHGKWLSLMHEQTWKISVGKITCLIVYSIIFLSSTIGVLQDLLTAEVWAFLGRG